MDDSPASHLPVELWIKIALGLRDGLYCLQTHSFLNGHPCTAKDCPKTDFKAVQPLSESCRFLRAVFQPILYEDIVVQAGREDSDRVAGLASTFSTRPDLRSAVRSLRLENVQRGGDCDALLDVLPLLIEVRFLSLRSGVIEEPIVKLLRNAPHLHTLRINNTRWGVDVPEKWSEDGSFGRNLTELHVGNVDADLPHYISRYMQLFVPTVTKLKINSKKAAELMESPIRLSFGPSLRQLVAKANDPAYDLRLHQFLSQCPNLEGLDAEGLCLVSPIDEEYLPKLRSVKANSSLVAALLPGRPIRSITTGVAPGLFVNPLPWLEMLHLSGLADRVSGLEAINALWSACPGLITLELQPMKGRMFYILARRIKTLFTTNTAALPRLQVLHLRRNFNESYWTTAIEAPLSEEMQLEQERIVEVKRQHCPDLYDLWLSPKYAWTYIRDDDVWSPQDRSPV